MRFRVVVHLVRHPLKAINSNRHFSDHLKRCTKFEKIEPSSVGGDVLSDAFAEFCEWNWWRLQQWEYARIFTPMPSYLNSSSAWPRKHHEAERDVTRKPSTSKFASEELDSSFPWPKRKREANDELVLPPPGQPGGFLLWEQTVSPPAPPLEMGVSKESESQQHYYRHWRCHRCGVCAVPSP